MKEMRGLKRAGGGAECVFTQAWWRGGYAFVAEGITLGLFLDTRKSGDLRSSLYLNSKVGAAKF